MVQGAREKHDYLIVMPVFIVSRLAGCCLFCCSGCNFSKDSFFTWFLDIIESGATDEVFVGCRLGGADLLVNVYSSFRVFCSQDSGIFWESCFGSCPFLGRTSKSSEGIGDSCVDFLGFILCLFVCVDWRREGRDPASDIVVGMI